MLSRTRAIQSRAVGAGLPYHYGLLKTERAQASRLRYPPHNPTSCRRKYSTRLSEFTTSIHDSEFPQQGEKPTTSPLATAINKTDPSKLLPTPALPITCPGCGALSQETLPQEAGHYSRSRRAVKQYLRRIASPANRPAVAPASIPAHEDHLTPAESQSDTPPETQTSIPVCDRCHDLIYNAKGNSIAHPSIENIADSIAESPFNRNHVYHVLDAADFPMSIISNIFNKLELAKPRSQNRRSRHKYPYKPTLSFIITRSDLLGATKEEVDKMMPYFQRVLRTALGRTGRDMRLGDVHLVSAKRGWWTKEIKDSIWERGGGNWMVGRVNVGKSNLFEVIFPKGSGDRAPKYAELREMRGAESSTQVDESPVAILPENSLLPPAQPEVPFPAMPVVSNLPGTTASPIRLPFGNHKGELIDLPGIARGNLEEHVLPNHKLDLVMQSRPNINQYVIKAGQSLLLGGGLIRITPQLDENTTMLVYPFLPIDAHVTATEKAVATQTQERHSGIRSILADGAGATISSAGFWNLTTDVTKSRAQPLIRAGLSAGKLMFRVYSTDILIEGVGWVELVCQVRRRRSAGNPTAPSTSPVTEEALTSQLRKDLDDDTQPSSAPSVSFSPFFAQPKPEFRQPPTQEVQKDASGEYLIPRVEISSPNGRHISQREPLQAWLMWNDRTKSRRSAISSVRPRRSMKGVKKMEKRQRQQA